jgi:hypothetical protein
MMCIWLESDDTAGNDDGGNDFTIQRKTAMTTKSMGRNVPDEAGNTSEPVKWNLRRQETPLDDSVVIVS